MNYFAFIPFTAFIINLFLFAYIVPFYPKSKAIKSYQFICLSVALWQLSDFLVWLPFPEEVIYIILRISMIFWMSIIPTSIDFVYQLIHKKRDFFYWLFFALFASFLATGLSTKWVLKGVIYDVVGATGDLGGLFIYSVFFTVVIPGMYSLILMGIRIRTTKDILLKKQLWLLLIGFTAAFIINNLIGAVLPQFLNITYLSHLGASIISLHSITIFIAIFKYRYFSVGIRQNAYSLFSQVTDALFIFDRHQRLVECNKKAKNLFQLQKKNRDEIIASSLFPSNYSFQEDCTGKELTITDNDREKVFLLSQNSLKEAGRLTGKLIVLKDITPRKMAEQEIKSLNRRLRKRFFDKTKELQNAKVAIVEREHKKSFADITTGILHNAVNVLTSMKLSSYNLGRLLKSDTFKDLKKIQLLLQKNIDNLEEFMIHSPKGKKLMTYFLSLGEILEKEIETGLKNWERLERKVESIEKIISAQQKYGGKEKIINVYLTSIIDDALDIMNETIERAHIKIVRCIEHDYQVYLLKIKTMHIIINLIKNARDAMLDTPVENRRLIFSLNKDEHFVYLKVQDSGCGINPENIDNVFTHGFTTKTDGHGYGLHSCRHYMREMGGDIFFSSEGSGKGTLFTVKFPYRMQVNTSDQQDTKY